MGRDKKSEEILEPGSAAREQLECRDVGKTLALGSLTGHGGHFSSLPRTNVPQILASIAFALLVFSFLSPHTQCWDPRFCTRGQSFHCGVISSSSPFLSSRPPILVRVQAL